MTLKTRIWVFGTEERYATVPLISEIRYTALYIIQLYSLYSIQHYTMTLCTRSAGWCTPPYPPETTFSPRLLDTSEADSKSLAEK